MLLKLTRLKPISNNAKSLFRRNKFFAKGFCTITNQKQEMKNLLDQKSKLEKTCEFYNTYIDLQIANNTMKNFFKSIGHLILTVLFVGIIFYVVRYFYSRSLLTIVKERMPDFSSICGNNEVKEELSDLVDYLRDPQKFIKNGATMSKGILLYGPPGCGKTFMAKALAGESNASFIYVSGSSLDSIYVGSGAKKIRELFSKARKNTPCIIFIDEIDAICLEKKYKIIGHGPSGLNQLLVEMDGFEENENIVVIGATNMHEKLPSALLRSGRFDKKVKVDFPDLKTRKNLFELYLKNKLVEYKINVNNLASTTIGFTGADIKNVCNMAANDAVKNNQSVIKINNIETAINILKSGKKKNSVVGDNLKKVIAVREAGRAIVHLFEQTPARVSRISIEPRSYSHGSTERVQKEDEMYMQTQSRLASQVDAYMGGIVAEEIVFGRENVSSKASSDLKAATSLAEKIVTTTGFGKTMGKSVISEEEELFLLTPTLHRKIDLEAEDLLTRSMERTKDLLSKHKDLLLKLADKLVEKETLSEPEILEILGTEKSNK